MQIVDIRIIQQKRMKEEGKNLKETFKVMRFIGKRGFSIEENLVKVGRALYLFVCD